VRRSPRWFVETVAWASSIVLLAGVGVVGLGLIDTKQVYGETPVVSFKTVTTLVPGKTAPRRTASKPIAHVRSTAHTGIPIEQSLGPPPGAQSDIVPTSTAAPEDRYAFLAGVTVYRKPTHDTLAGAQDVTFIRSLLLASGWLPENIRMVRNEQATGQAVREGLNWLAAKSTPGTFTFFHFSGHVKQEGGHEKLWPYDRQFVSDSDVASTLNRGSGKLWVDIAGCESGGFIENLPSSRVLVTTSSRSNQKSYEFPQWGESVWTGLVFDLGLGQGQADANNNGVTTIGEALRYAGYYAQAITLHQTPYGRQTPQAEGMGVRGWTLQDPPA
jgi:hypothetical protein